jgi:hypothetical protein
MNYWKVLRWTGAILFVVIVLVAWALAGRHDRAPGGEDERIASPIMR